MRSVIVRKRNKYWQYRFYVMISGERKEISKSGYRTKKEAEQAGLEAYDSLHSGGMPCLNAMETAFSDYLDYWLNNYCKVNLKATTCERYEKRIKANIKPRLGNYTLHGLTAIVLQNYINAMFNEGYSRNSLSSLKGILSGSLAYAVSPAGLLLTNPMTAVRLPNWRAKPKKASRKKTRLPITAEQWMKIMTRFPREHPSHIPLNLGYHLGLRLGEVFGLMWEDIDFVQGTVSVKRQAQWNEESHCWELTDPKYDSFRTITADSVLLALLKDEQDRQTRAKAYYAERYQQLCRDENDHLGNAGAPVWLVNTRENGTFIQPRTLQNTSRVIHGELNMPAFDFHSLRHTHATMLLESGASPLDVQERLGHTKLTMTWRYAHDTDAIRARTNGILETLYSV